MMAPCTNMPATRATTVCRPFWQVARPRRTGAPRRAGTAIERTIQERGYGPDVALTVLWRSFAVDVGRLGRGSDDSILAQAGSSTGGLRALSLIMGTFLIFMGSTRSAG